MSESLDGLPEREEIEMLLPWYVTGTLDRRDRERVAAYLADHPDIRRQLALIGEEREQSVRANEAIPAPGGAWQARLMAKARAGEGLGLARLWTRIEGFLTAPSVGAVQWAVAVAAVLFVAQAAVIGALVSSRPDAGYETAVGQPAGAENGGATALVRFVEAARADAIASALAELGITIVDGPKPGNLFRVRLGPADMPAAAKNKRITALRQRDDVVKLVLPGP